MRGLTVQRPEVQNWGVNRLPLKSRLSLWWLQAAHGVLHLVDALLQSFFLMWPSLCISAFMWLFLLRTPVMWLCTALLHDTSCSLNASCPDPTSKYCKIIFWGPRGWDFDTSFFREPQSTHSNLSLFLSLFNIYLFIWLHQVLGIFSCGIRTLSCNMKDLVP